MDVPIEYHGEEIPLFGSAMITLEKGTKKDKTDVLEIVSCSMDEVGIRVGEKDADLLDKVKKGDKLREITLYAPQAIVRINGTVRHKTKISNRNSFILRIEFDEALKGFSSL